jgi:hypothetical protein
MCPVYPDSADPRLPDALLSNPVAVLSKASINSRGPKQNSNAALIEELSGKGVMVLPVLIEDCEPGREVSCLLPNEAPLVVALPDHLLGHDVG